MPTLKPNTIIPSDKEDQEITRQAVEDGTHFNDAELNEFQPISALPALQKIAKAGRPKSDAHKVPVSIRLSPEVIDYFKASGKGWQTRLDAILKDYVASHDAGELAIIPQPQSEKRR